MMKKILTILLTIAVVCLSPVGVFADKDGRTIKVGYIGYDGFIEKNPDGKFEGYGVEYLEEISKYTGFNYEYVYCSWADSLEMLKNHEIDLVCTSKFSSERAEIYDYARQRFGVVKGVIYAAPDDSSVFYGDVKELNGKKIAFLKGSMNINIFADFALKNEFSYLKSEYESDKEMVQALLDKEVDLIATEQMVHHNDLKLIGNYGSEQYYLMSYKNCPFMKDIDFAMSSITANDTEFENRLYNKYYHSISLETGLNFTRKEIEFIKEAPIFTVAVSSGIAPMAYIDENGRFTGISVELLDEISRISGLRFQYFQLPGKDEEYEYDFFTNNNIDLISGIEVNEFNRELSVISLTDSYFSSRKSLVARKGEMVTTDSNLKIAIIGGSGTLPHLIKKYFPHYEIVTFLTIDECLQALVGRKADAVLYNQYRLEKYLSRPQYESLAVVPGIDMPEELALSPVVYKDEKNLAKQIILSDPRLISILNKSINSIGTIKTENIIASHTIARITPISFKDVIFKYRIPLFIVALLFVICIALLISIIISRQKNFNYIKVKNQQLAEAVVQAQKASHAKSQFLSRMSHEIRTPMNAIVGITAIAKTHVDDKKRIIDYLEKIDSSSKVLLNIINDVLDMSAIESEKLKISNVQFDIKAILTGIANIYYTQCSNKNINFSMAVDISQETLIGDGLRVNQILLNLVSNAYKFTPSGGKIVVAVEETARKEDTVFIKFIVSDTGCGMTEEMQQRLFRPFEQESAETAFNHGGSGLGLSIAKNLIDLMHGAISVESQKGKGTTFTVHIPFKASDNAINSDKEKLKNIKALVVDDDDHVREYTSLVLQRIGVHFDVAASGNEATAMIKEEHEKGKGYDICFIDWQMPGLDGIEVTRKIRKLYDKDTIIIIISAYDLSEVEEEAKNAGADLFVAKPIFQSTVFNILMQLTGGKYTKLTANEKSFDFEGKKVLLAEDNALNSEIATALLEMVNLKVDIAENGEKAVQMFENSQAGTYSAILMDIQMPIMDGYEAARYIRKINRSEALEIPILAMTANAFSEDVSAAISAGMNGHIAKPIDTDILYSTLYKIIK